MLINRLTLSYQGFRHQYRFEKVTTVLDYYYDRIAIN